MKLTTGMRVLSTSLVALSVIGQTLSAGELRGKSVTFADFGYVNSVASSINHVYFATTEGIIRYNKTQERWDEPLTGSAGMTDHEVLRIWVDTFDEKLYARTEIGLYEYDLFFGRWFPITDLPDLNRNYQNQAPPEDLLPATGEAYFGEGRFSDAAGRQYSISNMILDQTGTYWIGTWGYGPARALTTSLVMEPLIFGLTQNRVSTIYSEDSLFWLAGSVGDRFRSGLTAFNPETLASMRYESGVSSDFPAIDVNCLSGDKQYLYIGTEQGLYLMDKVTGQIARRIRRRNGLADDRVSSIAANGDTLLVGTRQGLSMITHAFDSIASVYPGEFYDQTIYDLEKDGDHIWLATGKGAYRLTWSSHRLQYYRDAKAFLFSQVYDIERQGEYLWFAADGGLLRLSAKSGKTETYQDQSSQLRRRVVAANNSIAAVNSSRGVTIFFLEPSRNRLSREFTVDDGLASSSVTSLYLEGDYLWIGSDRGLTRLLWNDPDRID